MDQDNNYTSATIMAAMATLSSGELRRLSALLSADNHRRHCRLVAVLSSPAVFSVILRRLHSLSLRHKSILIAHHLLSSLRRLTLFLSPSAAMASAGTHLRDYDAVSLLLLLCDMCHHHPSVLHSSPSSWLPLLRHYFSAKLLSLPGIGVDSVSICVESVGFCRRLLSGADGEGEEAAAAAAVVGLPWVEGRGGGCVICREEMRGGRGVCKLPCGHMFHWSCILPWLKKTNTCPCCRSRLPTDDVFGEIRRLWEILLVAGGEKVEQRCLREWRM